MPKTSLPKISQGTLDIEDLQLLREGAHKFGVELSEKQVSLFALLLDGLCLWNRRMNLTGISERREMMIKLLLDPLVALPYLPAGRKVLDVGSGAGIPGFPFKIARQELEIHLLESKAKKVSFLRNMIRTLGLTGIAAYQGRAENSFTPSGLFPSYDVVTARALAPLRKTVSICSPYLTQDSILVTFKGSKVNKEIQDSERLLEELHLGLSKKISYRLPETGGSRYLVILKKETN
ncbi:MAG: 16S rRNA (guanine(527)-N(7))-methyltransferase RsmG [Deltaproteobacteria bacterium]|nr:16S rRNA (guanine(527)-N(7))-methyltransferase RsmG [Deltaproteobacteria bacterium]MBW2340505.1 16S rRNA (guanine(527)-N(7))-methyltransferase RsmG [Deltaproteobacteria bacterium]